MAIGNAGYFSRTARGIKTRFGWWLMANIDFRRPPYRIKTVFANMVSNGLNTNLIFLYLYEYGSQKKSFSTRRKKIYKYIQISFINSGMIQEVILSKNE